MAGDLVAEYLAQVTAWVPERYPVVNREERTPLDGRMWHLIHERDGGICWMCDRAVVKGEGEVDHLVPRSSFSVDELEVQADRSWNLRLACVDCNQAKSNFRLPVLPRTIGVTSRCWECSGKSSKGVVLTMFAYCGVCGLTSGVPNESWVL